MNKSSENNNVTNDKIKKGKDAPKESSPESVKVSKSKGNQKNSNNNGKEKDSSKVKIREVNGNTNNKNVPNGDVKRENNANGKVKNHKKSNQKASNTSDKPLKSALKTKVPEKEIKDGEIKLNIDEAKKIVENGNVKPPVESKKVAIAENNVKEANIEKKETKIVENSILNATLESKEISPDEIKVIPNGDEKQQSQQNTEKSSDANQTAGTDEIKKSETEQNQKVADTNENQKNKTPLVKQSSKLDMRRRSSVFGKSMKKNSIKKPERPTPEKFLEVCKKGSWNSVEKIMNELAKDDKYEPDIADTDSGYGPIMYATKSGKADFVEKMISYGFDVNLKDKDGLTALHLAARSNRDDIIRLLMVAKADPMVCGGPKKEYPIHTLLKKMRGPSVGSLPLLLKAQPEEMRLIQDGDGYIALMYAVESQNFGICRELLSLVPKEQLEKKRKKFGDTVLHIATRKRDLEMVRLLREYGVDINSQNKEGSTPLHMVANDADDTWVRFLHNQGADPNIGDAQERTPLFLMVEKGSHRRVDYMIEKFGASINVRTKDGKTLVHAASKSRTLELPMSFIKKGIPIRMQDRSGSRAIHIAAQTGHVDLVKNLLSRGEDVQAKNNDGYTPLHVAVEAGKDEVTEILIANRADVNLTAEKGLEKPIHLAARCPTGKECVVLLIKSGAEINALNEIGRTPLMIAAEAGNLDTLCLLLDIHANIDIIDKNGENVFHIAVKMCHYQVAKQLLETIKNWRSETHVKNVVNQQNPQGEASLHYCAKLLPSNAHYESEEKHVTKLLIESGGDLVKEDFDKGDTPVHYCSRFGTDSVLEEIIRLTATVEFPLVVNKPSKNGFTPLLYACNHGHVGIIKQLLQHHARVDVFDEKGRAGLHLAAELGHHAIMDVLLENKAFVNVRNKFGMTPLHLAAKNGFTSMVQDLIKKYGAQVDPVTLNKQTPLHMAAEFGQLETCGILLELGADMRSVDNRKQTPLHLAAESNHSEVFRLFLEKNPDLLSSVNTNGQTCAHISAEKGSVSVMEELLKFDKETAIRCKIKNTEFTALHQAAEKGHSEVVKLLLDAGAPTNEESSDGMTALHLAARYGHLKVLEALEGLMDLKTYSRRNGLTALHVAASYGQADFVSELLTKVPGNILSQRGTIDPEGETDVTPLHLAAKSGHESVVRMLMNSTGVQIESVTRNTGMTPMHYAAEGGHIIVGGLLISRSNNLMYQQDKHGRTCMHHAAAHGHAHMITMLLGQGAEMEPLDKKNWTPLHHAARNGHLEVVKLLVEAGADSDAVNIDGKNAICLATGAGHTEVLSYLSTIEHDSNSLMEDRNFLMDLMFSSKNHENKPIHEFILTADAPIYVAVKLARCFENLANRDKDKAKDFTAAAQYCDSVAIDLLNVISTNYSTTGLLRAVDMKGTEFLDVLIELERKNVVSQHAVQKFLSRVWIGELQWSSSKFFGFFLTLIFCPFAWIYVSSPFNRQHLDRIPVIKFMSYLTAHILFIFLLCSILLWPTISIPYYQCCIPQWNEWLLILWLIGLLVSDLTNPKDRTGLGNIKTCIMAFGFAGIVVHLFTFFLNLFLDDRDVILSDEWKYKRSDALYVRNQIWAWALLFSFIDFLNFLTVHPLFGPWGVIIVDIIQDILKFVAVLIIFVAGFTLHICAIYQPVYRSHLNQTFPTVGQNFIYPARTLEMLTYALLGHVQMDDMPGSHLSPALAKILMKIMFGIYMTVTIIVLINLLIAMMSNTYSRIEEQSDIEWKFGRAKLIQNMNRTLSTPSPLNLFIGIPFMLRDRMKKDDKNKTEKRVKSAKSGVYSQYLDVDDKSAILSRRGSRTSIGTSKTMLMDDGGSKKEITKIVNWQAVIRKYHASKGAAQGKDDQED